MSNFVAGAAPVVLEAHGLYHIYRERDIETVALRGADLELRAATWTSIIGPSGCGKSTLVHVLGGLLEPSGGSVLVDREDITRLPPAERAIRRRRRIGVVMQRDNLYAELDVSTNVGLPLRLDGRPALEVRDRVEELLRAVGLADRARQVCSRLSGGEMQRVAIAVALAPRPIVLLADELTGELDDASTGSVLDLLDRIRHAEHTAILTVTHNPLVAARADRPLRMRDGLLVAA